MNIPQATISTAACKAFGRTNALARVIVLSLLGSGSAVAQDIPGLTGAYIGNGRPCTATADITLRACSSEVTDDFYKENAICTNESDALDRNECFADATSAQRTESTVCSAQHAARIELCGRLGETRYDPEFEEELFESEFDPLITRNPWFPLQIGNIQKFEGDETIEIEVLEQTRNVDDITCITVRDRVFEDGVLVEDTDDWYAQALDGSVWYCGEQVKDYELTDGDDPATPELVSIDGSFKHDREGDKAGIQFLSHPMSGDIYRQEFSIGNAEDVGEVLTATYTYGLNADLDRYVPADLARLLCQGNCVVIHEFSPMSPGGNERKYYARGIGQFFGVNVNSGDAVQLTECNYDARCDSLPEVQAR